jgi:hypothetical protein
VVTAFVFCAYPIYAYIGAAPSVERLLVSQLAATWSGKALTVEPRQMRPIRP